MLLSVWRKRLDHTHCSIAAWNCICADCTKIAEELVVGYCEIAVSRNTVHLLAASRRFPDAVSPANLCPIYVTGGEFNLVARRYILHCG